MPGQAFIPFHFGAFDASDSQAKAANELTTARSFLRNSLFGIRRWLVYFVARADKSTELWDPIPKQPAFKGGAVQVERRSDGSGEVKIHVKENHTSTVQRVASSEPKASHMDTPGDESQNTQCLEPVLETFFQGVCHLVKICIQLVGKLTKIKEHHSGQQVMRRLAKSVVDRKEPFIRQFKQTNPQKTMPSSLRNRIFSKPNPPEGTHGVLFILHWFHTYLCSVVVQLMMLFPVTLALWDQPSNVVSFHGTRLHECRVVRQQMKTKSPRGVPA